jgi:hypothetical protein
MSRKVKYVTIEADNRDKGKLFKIDEMSASQAEAWAMRVGQALSRAGQEVPDSVMSAGMAALSQVLLARAFGCMSYTDAMVLMGEMMDCVTIVRDPTHKDIAYRLMEEDIEEVQTRLYLRAEVLELHTGFSFAGVRLTLNSSTPATTSPAS